MVLKDHIRRGKVFIPKPKQMLTPLQEMHYPEHILPETEAMPRQASLNHERHETHERGRGLSATSRRTAEIT